MIALICVGQPQKLVADALGFEEGRVSKLLRSALGKLGVRNRAELLAIHGALVGDVARGES